MDRINEIRERASKATKGVWVVELYKADGWEGHYGVKSQSGVTIVPAHCSWDGFGDGASKNNADFIANSKSDIEYLLSEIDRLKAENGNKAKTELQNEPCAWCKGDWTDNFCVYDEDFFRPLTYRHVKFCPMCGRKLRSPAEERNKK